MKHYILAIEEALKKLDIPENPSNLYEPLRYFLSIGGKRTRPSLLLIAHKLFDDNWQDSINQALAIELFHNFTLIHDDIMDNAPVRRSMATVHEKWNRDVAILSGDVLLIKAYDYLLEGNKNPVDSMRLFNDTARLICEGQQLDMDFEEREIVELPEYIEMIRLKTAVLLACSLKVGAMNAGAGTSECNKMYELGIKLGLGFQLQDDFLDAFGDPESFGKQVGGDILNNKKTYLSIRLRQEIGEQAYNNLYTLKDTALVDAVKSAIVANGIDAELADLVNNYHQEAIQILDSLDTKKPKDELLGLSSKLMIRQN